MRRLTDEIVLFLQEHGFNISTEILCGAEIILVYSPQAVIFPVRIEAGSQEEAHLAAIQAKEVTEAILDRFSSYPVIVAEDRWKKDGTAIRERLLAHLERHFQIYARNCEARRIDKATAASFLDRTHSYGGAASKYRYGLFVKRHTGHLAVSYKAADVGELVAVACFSGARRWKKGDRIISSYEWVRYASLPGLRISGGMGKLLQAFIDEVHPDDIMSYADLEWSEGRVYQKLGFTLESHKEAVMFTVDSKWNRTAVRRLAERNVIPTGTHDIPTEVEESVIKPIPDYKFFQNFGSNKYRLKLTEYFIPLQTEKDS